MITHTPETTLAKMCIIHGFYRRWKVLEFKLKISSPENSCKKGLVLGKSQKSRVENEM